MSGSGFWIQSRRNSAESLVIQFPAQCLATVQQEAEKGGASQRDRPNHAGALVLMRRFTKMINAHLQNWAIYKIEHAT